MPPPDGAVALTFDLFGTILDLEGSLKPAITELLEREAPTRSPETFWDQWRARQRLEQYQDTIMMMGHAGYLETVRRALHYVFRLNGMKPTEHRMQELMAAWQSLSPFPEVGQGLERLHSRYRLVVLSNGDPHFLDHLVQKRVQFPFDDVISATGNGAVQAPSRCLPAGGPSARSGSPRMHDGFSQRLRLRGRTRLRLHGGLCEPLQAASRGLALPAGAYRGQLHRVGRRAAVKAGLSLLCGHQSMTQPAGIADAPMLQFLTDNSSKNCTEITECARIASAGPARHEHFLERSHSLAECARLENA